VISVTQEFIVKAVTGSRAGGGRGDDEESGAPICSTPELRKHYEQLVGAARDRPLLALALTSSLSLAQTKVEEGRQHRILAGRRTNATVGAPTPYSFTLNLLYT
jgi:hypothetical protein